MMVTVIKVFLFVMGKSTLFSIIWLLLVVGACSFFIWFMTDRVLYLASHPKAVDVEVIYTDSVVFPAVTICNQNLFRFVSHTLARPACSRHVKDKDVPMLLSLLFLTVPLEITVP